MGDNLVLNSGSGGGTVATDEIVDSGTVHWPLGKMAYGGLGTAILASDANPYPMRGTVAISGTVPISGNIGGTVSVSGTASVNVVAGTVAANVIGTVPVHLSNIGSVLVNGAVEVMNDSGNPLPVNWSGQSVSLSGVGTVAGTVSVAGTVPVSGSVNLSAVGTVTGTVSVAGTVPVAGSVNLSAVGTVTGTVSIIGTVPVSGTVGVSGTVPVSGTVSIAGTADVRMARTVSSVSAAVATDKMMESLTELTPKFALIGAGTATGTVVAAVGGKKIRVVRFTVDMPSAGTVTWRSGATDISGSITLPGSAPWSGAYCPVGHFETAVGSALILGLAGGPVYAGGMVTYLEVS